MKQSKIIPIIIIIVVSLINCSRNGEDTMAALHQISNSSGIMYTDYLCQITAVDHDGSQKQIFPANHCFISPVWSIDRQILFGLSGYPGKYPSYWDLQTDQFKMCEGAGNQDNIEWVNNPEEPYEVIVQDFQEIIRYNIETCEEIETIVNLRKTGPTQESINGFSFFPATNEIVYSQNIPNESENTSEYLIIKKTIGISNETNLAKGINPKWSPDGTMISFVAVDGVYVMNADGSNYRLLWRYDFGAGWDWHLGSIEHYNAAPNWSPDGKWLVFHLKDDENGEILDSTPVYCLSVIDGSIQEIAADGEFPVWIP